jgi:glutathione S-transferase
VEVNLKNKPKDLLELNPYAKVPVLVDGAGVIYESAVINEYLDEKFNGLTLLPKNALQRAKARIWIDFLNSRVHPAASDITHDREPDKALQLLQQHLSTLEKEMAGKRFIVGDYSLADVSFIPFYARRHRYGVPIDDNYPNLQRWGEELLARPAVACTL